MSEPALVLEALEVRYEGVPAVRGLDLEVGEGEIVGLVGPNGAGKSSTLHAVMGVVDHAAGDVRASRPLAARAQPGTRRAARRRTRARGQAHLLVAHRRGEPPARRRRPPEPRRPRRRHRLGAVPLPGRGRLRRGGARARSPAASSSSSRSPVRLSHDPMSCSSTSPHWASPRPSSSGSSRRWRESASAASRSSSSSSVHR